MEKEKKGEKKFFDVQEFLMDGERVHEAYVPEIDRVVRFKKLTIKETYELSQITERDKRAEKMLYIMLHKADPSITEEQISNLPGDVATVILNSLTEHFLQPKTSTD